MFARITTIKFQVDRLDEGVQLYQSSVVDAARIQEGFRGASFLTDRSNSKAISITLWESEEAAIANERSGYYQEQIRKFKDLMLEPPAREGYEVSIQA
jgi:heme-degrading monooxygenase HmoA